MKYFVVGDVHSFYDYMIEALDKAGFDKNNPEHFFVSCGDLFDRGDKPAECLDYVMSLPKNRRIFVRGNHEDLLQELIRGRYPAAHDVSNGTLDTMYRLTGFTSIWHERNEILNTISKNQNLYEYLAECRDYFETDNYIFVHGWIPCDTYPGYYRNKILYIDNWREVSKLEWEEARWFCGFDMWNRGVREEGKTIVCGHWHTSWAHSRLHKNGSEWEEDACFDPFYDDGIIGVDGCTVHSRKVNVVVLEEKNNA